MWNLGIFGCLLVLCLCFATADIQSSSVENHGRNDTLGDVLYELPHSKFFLDKYVKIGKPLIFKEAAKAFPAYKLWTLPFLLQNFGDLVFRLEPQHDSKDSPDRLQGNENETLSKFLQTFESEPKFISAQIPNRMARDIIVFSFLSCGSLKHQLHNAGIWLSSERTKRLLHKDSNDIVECLLNGTSKWILLHGDRDLDVAPASASHGHDGFDIVHIDQAYTKQYQTASLDTGDCIFLPGGYWRQIESFGYFNLAVSIPFTTLSPNDDSESVQSNSEDVSLPEALHTKAYGSVIQNFEEAELYRLRSDVPPSSSGQFKDEALPHLDDPASSNVRDYSAYTSAEVRKALTDSLVEGQLSRELFLKHYMKLGGSEAVASRLFLVLAGSKGHDGVNLIPEDLLHENLARALSLFGRKEPGDTFSEYSHRRPTATIDPTGDATAGATLEQGGSSEHFMFGESTGDKEDDDWDLDLESEDSYVQVEHVGSELRDAVRSSVNSIESRTLYEPDDVDHLDDDDDPYSQDISDLNPDVEMDVGSLHVDSKVDYLIETQSAVLQGYPNWNLDQENFEHHEPIYQPEDAGISSAEQREAYHAATNEQGRTLASHVPTKITEHDSAHVVRAHDGDKSPSLSAHPVDEFIFSKGFADEVDGVADHEPIYQPQEQAEEAWSSPIGSKFLDSAATGPAVGRLYHEDRVMSYSVHQPGDGRHPDDDSLSSVADHDPIYQPEDSLAAESVPEEIHQETSRVGAHPRQEL